MDIFTGTKALEEYLGQNDFDFHQLPLSQFTQWLQWQLRNHANDEVFQLRCKIRDLKKSHWPQLQLLEFYCQSWGKKYHDSPNRIALEELKQSLEGAQKAIDGLRKFLQSCPSGEKYESRQKKLKEFLQKQKKEQRQYKKLLNHTPEKSELVYAQNRLAALREKITLTAEETRLQELNKQLGKRSSSAGKKFEDTSLDAIKEKILPLYNSIAPQKIRIFSGVTLGCARAELDYVVAASHGSKDPVEVLAIVEVKRNINNLASGFLTRQENIAWFIGDTKNYNPSLYRTRVFTKGHFDCPVVHCENKEEFIFDRSSFRNFKRDPQNKYFLDHLFFITIWRRLLGMDTGDYSKIMYRVSTDPRFDIESELYLQELFDWVKELLPLFHSGSVVKLYASKEEWARQLLLQKK